MAPKIVIIGDVNGKFAEVLGKLSTLHSKQNFAFAIIAGEPFGEDDDDQLAKLLSGEIQVPLPTYGTLSRKPVSDKVAALLESNQGEICPNLTIFGRKTSMKTSEGFRIVSVGGAHSEESDDQPMSDFSAIYTNDDTHALATSLTDVDILISSDWPAQIQDGAKAQYSGSVPPQGVQSISDLCANLKPRYHFSASEAFYEREPFFHNGPSPRSITRFISLAPYGNPAKQKWIYAFSLEPSAEPPTALPPGCTASPFTSTRKRKLESQDYNNFRYANGNGGGHYEQDHRRGGKRRQKQPPPTPDQCFFCLSNPNCETHMIGSIGSDVYLTTSKGPLTTRSTFPSLDFPGHILLIPLQHAPTMSSIPDGDARQSTVNELQRYRSALQSMLVEKSKDDSGHAKLGAVTWEISRASGVHLHWQFLPVPIDLIQRGLVEAGFEVEAENSSYPKFAKNFKEMEQAEEGDFFKVMIWSEALRKEMVMPLDGSFRFDLQFGRRVLGKLLGLEKRTHWRDCPQSTAEEEADAVAFKEAFKDLDFSLET